MNSRIRSGFRGFENQFIVKVLRDVLTAISGLHHHVDGPIVHRDIKIENILVNANGEFVICDLGSATRDMEGWICWVRSLNRKKLSLEQRMSKKKIAFL